MASYRGIDCRQNHPLEPALRRWVKAIKRITDRWQKYKDVPWWYNERADLSILAGSLWRGNEVSVEEFVSEKRHISRRTGKLRDKYKGRIDIYFTSNGHDFIGEAKDCWSGASDEAADPRHKVEKNLERALLDIKKIKAYGDRKIGIVFAKPLIRRNRKKEVPRLIKRWLASIRTIECDAKAWYFPENARYRRWNNNYYPGVAVLITEK